MTRWMRPPDLDQGREREQFDPTAEGARYGLARELLLAIWKHACAEATDSSTRRDAEQAQQRFHAIAKRIAARGGRLRPGPGRLTRASVELYDEALRAWLVDDAAPRTPGRETLVTADARRWAAVYGQPDEVRERAGGATTSAHDETAATTHRELPGKSDVLQALAQLLRPHDTAPSRQDGSRPLSTPGPLVIDLAAHRSERPESATPEPGRLPAAMLERMERAYGQRFDDVEIHTDSAEVPDGEQAFTQGRHIYFGRDAFDLE